MNLQKYLNQTAVYWGSPSPNGFGLYTYGDPVEIKVRYSEKQEKFLSGPGVDKAVEELLSKSIALAETDMEIGGRLYLGGLIDLDSDSDPDELFALTVKGFEKIPNKKATAFLRKAWLV